MLIAERGAAGAALLPGVLQHCQAGALTLNQYGFLDPPGQPLQKERQEEDHA